MAARLDTRWQYNGLRAVVLDNPTLQITVLPETGARVYNLIHKPTDTNLLWHHPRNLPRHIPYGSTFDFGGHYATELSGNWFALTDTARQIGIGMLFPTEVFRVLWIWQVYGGWRGLYQLAVEPWVGYPVRLEEALEAGRTRILQPGEPLEYEAAMVVYTGLESVRDITQDGNRIIALA